MKDCIKDSYLNVLFIVPQTLNRKTIAPFRFLSHQLKLSLVLHEFEVILSNLSVVYKGFCKPNHWTS